MAATTSKLSLYKPTVGGDTDAWGTQLNANMDVLDNAATLTGTQTLTNKTISGASNTITNLALTTAVTGTLPVANGGTGGTTFTANNVLLGNGTGAFQPVAPGTSGNVLTSNGTTWVSSAPASGGGGSGTVTSVNVSGGTTGLSFTGGPITTTGTITASGTLAIANGGTGATSLASAGIVTLTGTQTLSGNKTFSGTTTHSGATNFTGLASFTTAGSGASFGASTPNGLYALYVQPAGSTSSYGGLAIQNNGIVAGAVSASDNTATPLHAFFYGTYGSAASVGNISTNGTSTAYNTSSDYRLKTNIQPMSGAVAKVKALKPVTYTWISNNSNSQGFIAHELQEVVPDAVHGVKDAVDENGNPVYQGVDASFLVATLTSALQEAIARIEALEAKA